MKSLVTSGKTTLVLILILVVAAGLRFYNLSWDNGTMAHPDERSTVAFYAPTITWPADTDDLLDPRQSPLNPFWDVNNNSRRSYTYGHFPLYVLVLTAHALHALAPLTEGVLPVAWTDFLYRSLSAYGFAQIGRALVALSDLLTVYLVFLIGRRLYGVWGGLLAAALSAFTVLQIQLAHFFAVDPISTTFTLLALYGAILMYDRLSPGPALVTGLGIGLAVASKFSALPVLFAPVAATILAVMVPQERQDSHSEERRPTAGIEGTREEPALDALSSKQASPAKPPPELVEGEAPTEEKSSPSPAELPPEPVKKNEPPTPPDIGRLFGLILLALLTAGLVFAVTSPFVLLDYENFRQAVIEEQGRMVSGEADFPFTRQYRNTTAYIYFIEQQLRWGMGWPLGLLALVGTLWVIVKAIRLQAQPGEWILLGWIVLYFGPTGLFLAKFMRYMIPVVPLFTLFGAGFVIALSRMEFSPSSSFSRLTRPLAGSLAAIVLLGSMVWALAFVNGVYGTEHTWVTFARWIYANVPNGSCIAWEHWDDRMPVDLPEPNSSPGLRGYQQPQLPMYEEDTREKYENLRNTLMNCDYIALATNRLWRTIPGLPQRYPMSTRYYEALFAGELGYEMVYSVETPPKLGPLEFDSQPADESFTVYDHPKPILFQKVRDLSPEEWDAALAQTPGGGFTWEMAQWGYVGEPTLMMRLRGFRAPPSPSGGQPSPEETGKSLLLEQPVDALPVVNDFRWNKLANNSTVVAILFWWLVVMGLGLLVWPLTFHLCHQLPDRGYPLSKSLGLLLVSYFVWLTSSLGLLQNRFGTIIIGLMLLIILNGWLIYRYRQPVLEFLSRRWRFLLTAELIFSLVYLFFINLRIQNPDLWQPWLGGEKMLEIGFLNAIVKSAEMPPYDPFFAGGIINYYYYGLFIVGVLIKLTGIQPSIAFNLAIPTLAGLTAINVFSLAQNIATTAFRPPSETAPSTGFRLPIYGLLAVLFVVFIGNLEGGAQFMRNLSQLATNDMETAVPGLATLILAADGLRQIVDGASLMTYNYWDPTRVIPQTINEFPYFSFLFADLHPHMIGIPFTVLFLSLAFNWLRAGDMAPPIAKGFSDAEDIEPVNQPEPVTNNDQANQHLDESPDIPTKADAPVNLTKTESSIPESPSVVADDSRASLPTTDSIDSDSPPPATPELETDQPTNSEVAGVLAPARTSQVIPSLLRFLALPFVLGALAVINTWDLPTYLGIMVATFLLTRYRRLTSQLTPQRAGLVIVQGIGFLIVILGTTYLMYWPFFANYQALDVGLGIVHTQTPLLGHLKIWGFFLFIIISWLALSLVVPASRNSFLRAMSLGLRYWNVWPHLHQIYHRLVNQQTGWYQLGLWSIIPLILMVLALFLLGYRVPAYLLPLVAIAVILLFRPEIPPGQFYMSLLAFTGLLLLLGLEIFFLRDFLGGGDYYRMNTLFKFFIQVWVIFGIISGVMLPQLWRYSRRWPWWRELSWRTISLFLLLGCLIYPIFGTATRLDDRFPGNRPEIGTLDGLAYMQVGTFEWPAGRPIQLQYDYQAIQWLQDNVPGTPILAEAKVGYYREGGMRVAAYTGLPSILGGLHQGEQRYASQIGARDMLVNEFWNTPDPGRAWQLMQELDIQYVYIGQVERVTHGDFVGDKFDLLHQQGQLELVYQNPQTKIYRRVE